MSASDVDALAERLGLSARLLVRAAEGGFASVQLLVSDQHWGVPDWSMAELLARGPARAAAAGSGITLAAAEAGWPRLEAAGSDVYSGTALRLAATTPADGVTSELVLGLQPTNYASTLLTHDPTIPSDRPAKLDRRRANLLGCSLWLLCADLRVIVTRRSHLVSWNPGRLASSASGGIDPADLEAPDPTTFGAARELDEELGVRPEEVEISFGGLTIGPDHMLDLVGVARTALRSDQVIERVAGDKHEISEMFAASCERESIPTWLASLRDDDWDPVSALGVLSLLAALHGSETLWSALEGTAA